MIDLYLIVCHNWGIVGHAALSIPIALLFSTWRFYQCWLTNGDSNCSKWSAAAGLPRCPELVEELQVSESTIRRDLDYLEVSGVAKRTHGGVFYAGPSPKLPDFDERDPAQWDKKKLIAQRAVKLIEDGDTLLLDGGSTTYEVARLLVGTAATGGDEFAAGSESVRGP